MTRNHEVIGCNKYPSVPCLYLLRTACSISSIGQGFVRYSLNLWRGYILYATRICDIQPSSIRQNLQKPQKPPNKAVNIWNKLCSFFSVLYGFGLIAAAFQGPSLFNDVAIIHLFATSRRGSFRSPFRLVFLSVSCSSPGEGGGDEAAVESSIVLSM